MTKLARRTFDPPWECKKPWPEDCMVQCGAKGIVFTGSKPTLKRALTTPEGAKEALTVMVKGGEKSKNHYRTAFFEAFPRNPDTFIRGEGKTVEEAEEKAWNKWQKNKACPGHEYEKRGYTNGAGFCKHCNMFKSKCYEPWEKCFKCGTLTYYDKDEKGNWWCEAHYKDIPEENLTEAQKSIREMNLEGKDD